MRDLLGEARASPATRRLLLATPPSVFEEGAFNVQAEVVNNRLPSLLSALADGLAEGLPLFDVQGFTPFVPRWQALHAYAGEAVDLIEGGRLLQQGIARGIDEIGCLLLDTRAGRIAVLAGDISLRKQLASGTSHALAD